MSVVGWEDEGKAQADSGGDDKENWLGKGEEEIRGGMSWKGENARVSERWEENTGGKREGDWTRNERTGGSRRGEVMEMEE